MHAPLTLYYRNDCHLCDEMLAELHALHGDRLELNLIDVDKDAGLRERYGMHVPVLMGGVTLLSEGRLDRSRLEAYLNGP